MKLIEKASSLPVLFFFTKRMHFLFPGINVPAKDTAYSAAQGDHVTPFWPMACVLVIYYRAQNQPQT